MKTKKISTPLGIVGRFFKALLCTLIAVVVNMAHGLFEIRSGEFSDIVHEIAAMERSE
ncbi:MAG: hypothetical protein J5802_08310 [Butyrivibrio sp.]|nr:hypothetical protein [Butyrivibrio sp.]